MTQIIGTEFGGQEWELQVSEAGVRVLSRKSVCLRFHHVAYGTWDGEKLVLRPGRGQITSSDVRCLTTVLQTCLQN